MQIHTSTMVQGWGGGGGMDLQLSTVFGMLQYFETIFPSVEGLYFDILYKLRYISWVVSLLGACDVTNNGRHLGRHHRFYQDLKIR